ncbi:putative NADPH-quinone reductase [Lipingzhangella halophila]|uniref:Putative NADPH-quinone reductase n=1 Tax=Lipingzhangella halophila TaxID=1783352 RepID=A0A7W7RNR7_9ACTN|nr:NAD(P)H oxidoreductase [Lipingzhangella halophila]MBB4935374.1 putative NADPH-quinone reductase [Lipingzhangella halophila]
MSAPHALLVLAHPRSDSLTTQIAARARRRLECEGHTVDVLDLYAEGFDPRLTPDDEPDWDNPDKEYSAEVQAHMRRIDAADTIIVVFPVWWFAPPAILKGWIDRVWNHGFAYGRATARLSGKRMLWIGAAGGSRRHFARDGMDDVLDRQLRIGVSAFCGIEDASVRLVHDTLDEQTTATAADAALGEFLPTCAEQLAGT